MANYPWASKGINPHYNCELELLLTGDKEVAYFSTGFYADSDWPEQSHYEKYLQTGALIKIIFRSIYQNREIEDMFICRPNAAWRVEEIRRLEQKKEAYSQEDEAYAKIEREIGKHLGYTDCEIAEWLTFFSIGMKDNRELNPDLHDGRELQLMLKNEKPLAWFYAAIEEDRETSKILDWEIKAWEPYEIAGLIIRKEYIDRKHFGNSDAHQLFYALPGEEWRIEELHQLTLKKYAHSDPVAIKYETRISQLLGYSDKSIETYIRKYKVGQKE